MALDMNWLKDEKRIIWRVIWMPLGRMIWWMDGMDLRRPFLDPSSTIIPVEKSQNEEDAETPPERMDNEVAIDMNI